MPWRFHNKSPVFIQIADRIRGEILSGKYPPEGQIPPVRQLAFEASVNPNTMQHALTLLEDEGLITTHGTVGRFVTSDAEALARARKAVHESAMRSLVADALALGITREELIEFIQKEETSV